MVKWMGLWSDQKTSLLRKLKFGSGGLMVLSGLLTTFWGYGMNTLLLVHSDAFILSNPAT